MDDQNGSDSEHSEQDEIARARALILSRRRALMAAAMTGLSAVGACNSKSSVCLSIAQPDSGMQEDQDAAPSVCLSIQKDASTRGDGSVRIDAGPTVCLSPPYPRDGGSSEDGGRTDAGSDAGADAGLGDAGPSVCLSIAP